MYIASIEPTKCNKSSPVFNESDIDFSAINKRVNKIAEQQNYILIALIALIVITLAKK
jgi:hypothetical protein